jgi:hypothetical protein
MFGNEMVSSVLGDVRGRGHPRMFTFEPAVKALIDVGFIVDDVFDNVRPEETSVLYQALIWSWRVKPAS